MMQANYLTEAARMQAWVNGLKPGDKVAVSKRGGWGEMPFEVLTVDRLTDSKVLTDCGRRFSRAGLHELGVDSRGLGRPHLEPATPVILNAVEAFHLARWLEMTARQRLPLATLRAMRAAYDAAEEGIDLGEARRAAEAMASRLPVSSDWFANGEVNALRRALKLVP